MAYDDLKKALERLPQATDNEDGQDFELGALFRTSLGCGGLPRGQALASCHTECSSSALDVA